MASDKAVTIRRHIKRADSALLKTLAGHPTGYFTDIQGRRGALGPAIRPLFPSTPFIGSALTVRVGPGDNLVPYLALGVIAPGDVLVIATGGWTGSAVLGDLMAGFFKNAGAVAVVTDGMARDVKGLTGIGLPVYAQGLTPNAPQKNGPGEIGGEISIGGVVVRAGDIVVGDADGVVILPQACFADAVKAVDAIKTKEAGIEREIAAGVVQPTWIREFLAGEGVSYVD
jgi:4-hydroxy-4-methyl-2-oxoglutarate aldolase